MNLAAFRFACTGPTTSEDSIMSEQEFAGIRGAHVAVDHADDLMTVTAAFQVMAADMRQDFLRTCRAIAAANDVNLRLVQGSSN
jgi:hypothetical protein